MTTVIWAVLAVVLLLAVVVAVDDWRIRRRMNRPTITVDLRADASGLEEALKRAERATRRLGQ